MAEFDADKAAQDAAEEYRKAQDKAAREDAPEGTQFETDEEYKERVAAARRTGIFGDTETSVGNQGGQDVVSTDNEAATVAVAEADAEGEDASVEEARRQVDVSAGTTESAEAVEAGADEGDSSDDAAGSDEGNKTAAEVIEEIEAADEVDALADGDERKTVQAAAEKRKAELS